MENVRDMETTSTSSKLTLGLQAEMAEAHKQLSSLLADQAKAINKVMEDAVRVNAVPPIKGPITKGKLQWRGIKLIRQNEGFEFIQWVEQRGEIISPKIRIGPANPELLRKPVPHGRLTIPVRGVGL